MGDRNAATYIHGDGCRSNEGGKVLSKMMKRDKQMRHTVGKGRRAFEIEERCVL